MNRRERLLATLRGDPVDRPAVNFYELNGLTQEPEDLDPFNIYSHPSWQPLLDLTREKTDRIVMQSADFGDVQLGNIGSARQTETFLKDGSRITIERIQAGDRILTMRSRRNPDLNTTWIEEHLLKDVDDLRAFLEIPVTTLNDTVDTESVIQTETALGDSGIVMMNAPDPLCLAACLFHMEEYTLIAMFEQNLFHQLIERFAEPLWAKAEAVSKVLPGRLWRIYGPEYASPPYLPPYLFREYVCRYIKPMVDSIQRYGGYARIHSHGRLKDILDDIAALEPAGLDPIEPPPQGDVELEYVRQNYGKDVVLFGNLEVSDIERMPTDRFAEKVKHSIDEGTSGNGRGFVLMPSACPYGRNLSPLTLKNYEKIIEIIENL
jgi:hypothetical protein